MRFKRFRRQIMMDAVVIGLIILGGIIFYFIASRKKSGWEITKGEEILSGEEKEVLSSILIYDGGKLKIEDSTVSIVSEYDNQFGILIGGDSLLELNDSLIESDGFQYQVMSESRDGKSPKIKLKDSVITDHSGIVLRARTRFEADDSKVEELQMRDRSKAQLKKSKVYPVLFSDKREHYKDLSAGEKVDLDLESNMGWQLKLDDCEVWGYQIDLFKDDDIKVSDSKDIVLSVHSSGDLEEEYLLNIPIGKTGEGEFTDMGINFEWENTKFDMLNLYVNGGDRLKVESSMVNELDVADQSRAVLENLDLVCNLCSVYESSDMRLRNVTVVVPEDEIPTLTVWSDSQVEIEDSDVSELKIIIYGGTVTIKNSKYDERKIREKGGELIIEDVDDSDEE